MRQEIVREDGRTVAVVLNTQDKLTVTHSVVGNVVFATSDEKYRPFSPILRHNEDTDEVLLQIRCEAELNEDGGYVTDADGNPSYQGRFFRLSWLGLRNLNRLGVDSLSFSQNGVQMLVRLEDILNEEMQETDVYKRQGFGLGTAAALLLAAALVYLLVRKNPYDENHLTQSVKALSLIHI